MKQLRSKGPLPLYIVTGDDSFLRDQVVAAIRAASLGDAVADFNEDKFTAGEVDVERVVSAARTVPMMSSRRFVLVRGVERWDVGDSEKKSVGPLDALAAYAASPIASTCVVLCASKLDGRRKLSALAKKGDFVVTCDPIARSALPKWVVDRCAALGHTVETDVADFIAEIAGPELAYVSDAVERLSLYVGEKAPITEQAVSECVVRVRRADTWALVAAVGARDLKAALRLLVDVYDPRDRGLLLLGAIAWSMRQLAKYHAAVSVGASSEEAAQKAGVPPFRARELVMRAKSVQTRDVERWLITLAETDLALKSSRKPPDAILEEMLIRLCAKAA